MTSSLESTELRYIRSRAAPIQRHGAPPKIMPQSDISFHSNANCESIDLLIRQSIPGLGNRQKKIDDPDSDPGVGKFQLTDFDPYADPTFCIRAVKLVCVLPNNQAWKNPGCFPNVETILRLFLCLMVTNCSSERSFSKLKRIKVCFVQKCHKNSWLIWVFFAWRMINWCNLLILMTPFTNSQSGKLEGRPFYNKLLTTYLLTINMSKALTG